MLAFGDCRMPDELKPFTHRTVTDRSTLEAQLLQTRKRGYAIDDEEYNYGVRCVAAPVYDHRGSLVGTIGISGPAGRVTLERIDDFGSIVKDIANALSTRLGYDAKLRRPPDDSE